MSGASIIKSENEAYEFLRILDPFATQFTFQTFADRKEEATIPLCRTMHGSLSEVASDLSRLNDEGACIAVTINETDFRGRRENNIKRIRAFFIDLDGAPLKKVEEFPLKPHMIVNSSPNRWHCYWLVNDCPKDKFRDFQKKLIMHFNSDQSVKDIPRVMRLPGYYHCKSTEKFFVNFHSVKDIPSYSLNDFDQFFIRLDENPLRQKQSYSNVIPVGMRNKTLASLAGKLRWRGETYKSIYANLLKENVMRCNPPLDEKEVDSIAQSISSYPMDELEDGAWEPPQKIQGDYLQPSFPNEIFPAGFECFLHEISKQVQVPRDLPAMLMLTVISLCNSKAFKVDRGKGWVEPLNLFTITLLRPASRKSTIFNTLTKPVRMFESQYNHKTIPEQEQLESERRILELSISEVEQAYKRRRSVKSAEDKLELEDLREQLRDIPDSKPLELFTSDVTSEKLESLINEQKGSMGVLCAEGGGVFANMVGRYHNQSNIEIYLKGHAGDLLKVHRGCRDSIVVDEPLVTLGLTVQPGVISKLDQREMVSRGLTARMLFAYPVNLIGHRQIDPPEMSKVTLKYYDDLVTQMLERRQELLESNQPIVLTLTDEARSIHIAFEEELERRLGPENDLEPIEGWAGKLAGAVLRIAGNLHLCQNLHGYEKPINSTTMLNAVRLGRDYLISHAKYCLLDLMGGMSDERKNALELLEIIKKNNWTKFARRELHQAVRGKNKFKASKQLDVPISILLSTCHIRELPSIKREQGGRPSENYLVNPIKTH